jgi:hypothetical protein
MLGAAGIFAVFGPIDLHAYPIKAFWLVVGLFLGSALWWLTLATAVGTFHQRFLDRGMLRLNRISGAIIALCGVGVLSAVAYRSLCGA